MLLHEFAHVEPDQRVAIAEQKFRQCLGQKRLADAAGPEEDEAAHRPVRVLHAAPAATHRLGHRRDRLVL